MYCIFYFKSFIYFAMKKILGHKHNYTKKKKDKKDK